MQPEKGSSFPDFRPQELRARIHTSDQLVFIFRGLDEWLRHVVRHFANRSEPWARFFSDIAPKLYSLRDRIPGRTDQEKEQFLDTFENRCQNGEEPAVSILRAAYDVYAASVPALMERLGRALSLPRYAHFPDSNPLSRSRDPGVSATYAIGDSFPAIMVIRGADLRTCYFIPDIRGVAADLPVVQRHLFKKCGIRRLRGAWIDHAGAPAYPYTEKTMAWSKLSSAPRATRAWRPRHPPALGGST